MAWEGVVRGVYRGEGTERRINAAGAGQRCCTQHVRTSCDRMVRGGGRDTRRVLLVATPPIHTRTHIATGCRLLCCADGIAGNCAVYSSPRYLTSLQNTVRNSTSCSTSTSREQRAPGCENVTHVLTGAQAGCYAPATEAVAVRRATLRRCTCSHGISRIAG